MEQIPQQKVKVSVSCSVMSETLQSHGLGPTRLICLQNSLVNDTEVGCHFLFWRIFLTSGIEPGSPTLQVDSLPLSHLGSPCLLDYGSDRTYQAPPAAQPVLIAAVKRDEADSES